MTDDPGLDEQQSGSRRTPPGGTLERVNQLQQRHRVLGFPVAVVYKYVDDGAGNLAAQITYYAFVSLFPLLLLASTILGVVLRGDTALQERLLDSALSQLPVVGDDLQRPEQLGGGVLAVVIGIVGALYGAMGVGLAVQNAANSAWTVPRNERGNPLLLRGRSIVLLSVIAADVVGTTALAGLVGSLAFLGALSTVAVLLVTLCVHVAAFAFVFRFAARRDLAWREVAPGAVCAGAAWLALQYVGVAYVARTVNNASGTNGVFAVVLGLLAFLYLTSVVLMLCIEINVVLADRLWPRTLLTPFTDNVRLTAADRRSYTDLASAQQLKGFQRVEVEFDPSPAEEPAAEPAPDGADRDGVDASDRRP